LTLADFANALKQFEQAVGNDWVLFPIWNFFARAFVIVYFFPIEHDIEKNRRHREIFRRLVKTAARHGWGEYRTHTAFLGDIMDTYSFHHHALLRLDEAMKDALDPHGILSPGENGLWPKGMIGLRAEKAAL
jgi:(+)-pinoresinol hydroxylase